MNPDPYYSRSEVSNSDLSWLKQQLHPVEMPDPTEAYRFGSLIDAMITEPHRVNFLTRSLDGHQFTADDFERAEKMKRAFLTYPFCNDLLNASLMQKVMSNKVSINYKGIEFSLNMRCKWDLWIDRIGSGGDIKSTSATTQKQFEDAVQYFDYDRQRAVYMQISGAKNDVLIGISKVNFKVFKVFINRESPLYVSGMEKFRYLAFHWHTLFGEDKSALLNTLKNTGNVQ
jgi:hypothetical protein